MAKTLKQLSDELVNSTKDDLQVDISPAKAKKQAKSMQEKMYEAEKKTGAPVPDSFKAWKALD